MSTVVYYGTAGHVHTNFPVGPIVNGPWMDSHPSASASPLTKTLRPLPRLMVIRRPLVLGRHLSRRRQARERLLRMRLTLRDRVTIRPLLTHFLLAPYLRRSM